MTTLQFDPPIHPGEVLHEEFLAPLGLSAGGLAARLGVPRTRIERIVKQQTAITPDTALRLSRALNTSAEFWLNMQASYDLATTARANADDLAAIKPLATA